jgi:hypothetical protein
MEVEERKDNRKRGGGGEVNDKGKDGMENDNK